jgi:hypothetical protein
MLLFFSTSPEAPIKATTFFFLLIIGVFAKFSQISIICRKSFSLFAKSLRKHRSAFANKEKEFLKLAQFKKKKVI